MKSAAIHHDHATFRVILQAMSHPGRTFALPFCGSPARDHAALIMTLGCLLDNEVTFSIIEDDDNRVADVISFHTGSVRVGISKADFVIAARGRTDGLLASMRRGTLEYPDTGATVIYLIDDIAGEGGRFAMSGPGIKGTIHPLFTGLATTEMNELREVNTEYPLGVDALFLDAHGRIACIPRSIRIGAN